VKWETRRLDDIVEKVIPHFVHYPLLSGKRCDFERFAVVCDYMRHGAHRTREGLIQIVKIASEKNPSGQRRYGSEEVLAQLFKVKG
jgi:hypothetical protein